MVSVPITDLNQKNWQRCYMFLHAKIPNGPELAIIARHQTEDRLAATCFRGRDKKLAGNFSCYDSVDAVFADPLVFKQFVGAVESDVTENMFQTNSITINHTENIGWESTDLLDDYDLDMLEPFNPNRKSSALRVRLDRTDILATRADKLTIVYELRREGRNLAAIIHSIYPGEDVGEICGNITERENRVFFDWGHPGV